MREKQFYLNEDEFSGNKNRKNDKILKTWYVNNLF